ncbi:hypothetical protein ICN82_03340, partial [Mangrovicoccus sp. HB182678]|nr:hypothetical protein [Mangrovicoccus algicola]
LRLRPGAGRAERLSARAGAFLGTDSCRVSLPAGPRRLEALAAADLPLALTVPADAAGGEAPAAEALACLRAHRSGTVPVLLEGAGGAAPRLSTLDALDPAQMRAAGMVLIGGSASRVVAASDPAAGIGGVWVLGDDPLAAVPSGAAAE